MKDLLNIEDGYSVKIIMLKGEKGDKGDSGDAGDYSGLTNKPKINNIELVGNILASDLGLASVGSVGQVDGRVDQLSQAVNEDIGQVNHNFATIENSFVAENAYSVGEYMVIYGQLYCATSAISIGDTMDESTNIAGVSVGAELTKLQSNIDSAQSTLQSNIDNVESTLQTNIDNAVDSISSIQGDIDDINMNLNQLGVANKGTVVRNTLPPTTAYEINNKTVLDGSYIITANVHMKANSGTGTPYKWVQICTGTMSSYTVLADMKLSQPATSDTFFNISVPVVFDDSTRVFVRAFQGTGADITLDKNELIAMQLKVGEWW